ncbi:PREDICTED: transcription factor HES-4 [Corvus brachyrhynchos]|uniref:transcription factor HES-4 n=1 Tax=Corvus brachyrhynchos TaxID=85066 RepID=UPI0004DDEF0F|nr:PREDICTED: transcription factor HES-4 [Corvus brachyrhynchos]
MAAPPLPISSVYGPSHEFLFTDIRSNVERRRGARINESLGQLKTLILDALKKDSSRHSKLEKADILEMTVKHLRNLQRAQMTAALSADPTVLGKYRAGFNECMNEVTRFLSTCEGVNTDVRTRLLSHLSACLGQIVAMNYPGGGSGNAAATPSASPVQGLTSFGGSIGPASQAGSPIGERSESVWRPW